LYRSLLLPVSNFSSHYFSLCSFRFALFIENIAKSPRVGKLVALKKSPSPSFLTQQPSTLFNHFAQLNRLTQPQRFYCQEKGTFLIFQSSHPF
jgi:hypothetical protein